MNLYETPDCDICGSDRHATSDCPEANDRDKAMTAAGFEAKRRKPRTFSGGQRGGGKTLRQQQEDR